MKRVLLILIVFAFAKANNLHAQSIFDKDVAPANKINGPYEKSLKLLGIKGDVAMSNYSKFDRDGQPLMTNIYTTDEEAKKFKGRYLVKNNRGQVTREITYTTKIPKENLFTYDSKGLITKADYGHGVEFYEYDDKSRVIKNWYIEKDETTPFRSSTYTYKKEGDVIIVLEDKSGMGINPDVLIESRYKNGFLLSSHAAGYPIRTYDYTYDKKGNLIASNYTVTGITKSYEDNTIIYYSELDDPNSKIEVKIIKDVYNELYYPSTFLNGKPIRLPFSRLKSGDYVFYNPYKTQYMVAKTAFTFNKKEHLDKTFPVEVLTTGEEMINYQGAILDNGNSAKDIIQSIKAYDVIASYVEKVNATYLTFMDKSNDDGVVPMKRIDGSLVYIRDIEASKVLIIEKGKSIDYSAVTAQKTTTAGDLVIFMKEEPVYILSGYSNAASKKFYPAIKYTGEQLEFETIKEEKSTEPAKSTEAVEKIPFNKNASIEAKKLGETAFEFYQNGLLIENPKYFIKTQGDVDLLFGYGMEDFVISDYTSVAMNAVQNARRVAKENEVIVMYKDGKAAYFYNNGAIILREDYELTVVEKGRWLVYLKKLNKSIFVDVESKTGNRFGSSYSYAYNDWLHKTETGVTLFTNGQSIKSETFKFYLDKGGNAHFYINEKPAYYLANYNTKSVGNYAMVKHTGQIYVK